MAQYLLAVVLDPHAQEICEAVAGASLDESLGRRHGRRSHVSLRDLRAWIDPTDRGARGDDVTQHDVISQVKV
jgi:hypothetical protein